MFEAHWQAREPRAGTGLSHRADCALSAMSAGEVEGCGAPGSQSVKHDPWSDSLDSVASPPMRRANCRLMVSPGPVPPVTRVSSAPACSKGWKLRSRSSGATPVPVSVTWM